MTWTLSQNGTQTTGTLGTEYILATDTNNGTFVIAIDLSGMNNGSSGTVGDLVELRVYTKELSSGTGPIQAWKGTYQNAQINGIKISPPIASDQSLQGTIKQVSGSVGRSYPWKFLRI